MTTANSSGLIHAMARMNRIVFLELIRRKDLAVLTALIAVFLFFVAVFRVAGIENDATATFLLNMGLTLSYYSAHILVIFLACRQMPGEIENRTIYPLLARPIQRSWVVYSRTFSIALCGVGIMLFFSILCWLFAPKREVFDHVMLVQILFLNASSLGMVTALTVFLSLILPRVLALVTTLSLFFLGGKLIGAAETADVQPWLTWCLIYMPDFTRLNLITRYTDGMPGLSPQDFLVTFVYATLMGLAGLFGSVWVFDRRSI